MLHPPSTSRPLSLQVGMQNSALGAVLASVHFAAYPLAAVPCAISGELPVARRCLLVVCLLTTCNVHMHAAMWQVACLGRASHLSCPKHV